MFEDEALAEIARAARGGRRRPGGIESGMLHALLPTTPGMVVQRAKLPPGPGTWPAFRLNPGVEYRGGRFSATPWRPRAGNAWTSRDRARLAASGRTGRRQIG
jgi:hypothetical protein